VAGSLSDDARGQLVECSSAAVFSVVLPAWNGRHTIADCLQSVFHAAGGRDIGLIVVESSGDAVRDLISREFPSVLLLCPTHRMQSGAARNHGLAHASGELVFFVDQDCVVPEDWFDQLVQLFDEASVGAAGGSVGVRNPANLSGMGVYFLEFFRQFPSRQPAQYTCSYLVGCNLAVRRSLYPKVKFNEQTLGEDVLFSDAIVRSGQRLVYAPSVSVSHWNRSGLGEFFQYNWKMGVAAADYQNQQQLAHIRPFLKYPFLVLFTPPFNCVVISWKLLRVKSLYLPLFILLLPLCLVGNTVWAISFYWRARLLT